jgi:hypothetical protein
MSHTLSTDTEVQPDESVSQVRLPDDSDNDGDESDIYGNPVVPPNHERLVPRAFNPRVSRMSKSSSAFFMITADTENKGRKFLKVSPNTPNEKLLTDLKEPYLNFRFRLQESRSKPGRSEHWQHYDEGVHRTTGIPHCLCKYCHNPVMHPYTVSTNPTNSIARHYPKCKQYKAHTQGGSESQSTMSSYFQPAGLQSQRNELTQAMVEEEILKYVISGNIPFNQVENQHFRNIISFIQIRNKPVQAPSRKVIRARLSSKSEQASVNLRAILAANASKISLALDCWSTRTNYSFLGMYSTSR